MLRTDSSRSSLKDTPLIPVTLEHGDHTHTGYSHFDETMAQTRAEQKCKACEQQVLHYGGRFV